MPTGKSICLGNNNTLICLDQYGQVYDAYYPHIGLENHTMGEYVHKIGVQMDDTFSWLDDGNWQIEIDYKNKTMISSICATHTTAGIRLHFEDCVYNEKDIFIRKVMVYNQWDEVRNVTVYFNQQFELYESFRGDTALYDRDQHVIIHYKGDRAILINTQDDAGTSFTDYTVGLLGIEGKDGSFKDAEDGRLEKNNVEHGKVDSVIGCQLIVPAKGSRSMFYWMVFERSITRAKAMDNYITTRGVTDIFQSTQSYWHAWLSERDDNFSPKIDAKYLDAFYKSLLLIQTHSGGNGAIIASGDSDLLKMGRGTYSYIWPRDGALVILPLIQDGYLNTPKRFFHFCKNVITQEGFMLHKYRADKTLGSSWHPWVRDSKSELPIQEDETALVVYALGKYYEKSKDLEFIEEMYDSLIRKPANFMSEHMHHKYNLPLPTYDLWEEKFGISTFTTASIIAALGTAAYFATILGKTADAEKYSKTAEKFKKSLLKYLWDEELGCFVKLVNATENGLAYDKTVDMSSVHALLEFGILDVHDPRITRCIETVEKTIMITGEHGGLCRYQDDDYFRATYDQTGNPWFITTLWRARYYLHKATTEAELQPVFECLDWVLVHAQQSGVLSEQINPINGEQLSATPLTWSQAEYVKTILDLNQKLQSLT